MKIIVDNEKEKQLIESLCDVALRAGGVRNIQEVNLVLASIKLNTPKDKGNMEK